LRTPLRRIYTNPDGFIGFIETTISSYLMAWRNPELSMAAKQQTTRQWWDERREHFDLFIASITLVREAHHS